MGNRVFTQTFGVVGAIIEKDGKFLLVQEAAKGKGTDAGKWSHPAGWVDVGEKPLEAARREVKEETGYDFTPANILGVYSLVREDNRRGSDAVPHAIKLIPTGVINNVQSSLADDVTNTHWFTPEEIQNMDSKILRDVDIKKMVRDYQAGKRYPLEILTHTIQK